MEIQKFEAYSYKGKPLMSIDRKSFISELIDSFMDQKLFGYEVNGMSNDTENEIIYIDMDNYSTGDYKTIKLDFSDLGIEIGTRDWNEDDVADFVPQINLDTPYAKKVKDFSTPLRKEYTILKKGSEKYNL